jgi:hypothetical protein
MTFDPKSLNWETLLKQIQLQPHGELKQTLVREAMERIWDGPNQPEERVNPMVFEPEW